MLPYTRIGTDSVERRNHLRWVLEWPALYKAFQNFLGAEATRRRIANEILAVRPGERVLDVGCGPGDILDHLPEVDYVGIDYSEAYIHSAQKRFGHRGTFIATDVKHLLAAGQEPFDLIFAIGLLHHIDDQAARSLLTNVNRCLKKGGRFVSLDPLIESPQNPIARFLARSDRGRFVRTLDGYKALTTTAFSEINIEAKRDLSRIPYSHCLLVARAG
jgi:cyclopropane fatty-acyl-phospholipid synthase-like methyltransferase